MFALLLITIGNLFQESATAIGKKSMDKRQETIYGYAFLSVFWFTIFLIIFVAIGASFHFSKDSLPYFVPRLIIEIMIAQLGAIAIHKAQLSTFSFLRQITIPLLLVVDIIVGYEIGAAKMLGMLVIFGTVIYLLGDKTLSKKGSKYIVAIALLSVINLSLFKYDITHFNSVAAEQIVVGLCLTAYFTVAGWLHKREKTWEYLYKARTEIQSLLTGFGTTIGSFAFIYVPASVATTYSRSTELLFAILFGNIAFHERKLGHKLAGFAVISSALILIAIN